MKQPIMALLFFCTAALSAGNLLEIPSAERQPVIDGVLEKGEWDDAASFTGMQLTSAKGLAKEQSTYYFKWDRDFIYFAAVCQDSNIRDMDLKMEYDDCLELFFQAPEKPHVIHWLFYASGNNHLDFIDAEYGSGYRSEKGRVQSAVKINAGNWTLEGRIPAESFYLDFFNPRYDYKFNVHRSFSHRGTVRRDGRPPEFSSFAMVRGQFLKPLDFATLRLGKAQTPPVRLEKLEPTGMTLACPDDMEVIVAFDDGKILRPAGKNAIRSCRFPGGCPAATIRVLRPNGETVFANRYDFFPDDREKIRETAERQKKTGGLGVDVRDSMARIFRNRPYASQSDSIALTAAKNERENFQIVLFTGKEGVKEIKITAGELKTADGKILSPSIWNFHREGYAIADPVGYPAIIGAGEYPDPLYPLESISLDPMEVQAVWAEMKVPENASPGEYRGAIRVSAPDGTERNLSVTLKVWDFAIPKKQSLRNFFHVWEREIYNLYFLKQKRSPEEFRKTVHQYAMMLVNHRLSPQIFKTSHLLPPSVAKAVCPDYIRRPDGTYEVKADLYDSMVREYLAAGANGFFVGPEVQYKDYTSINETDWKNLWKAIRDHYKANGLLPYAYAYPFDEPGYGKLAHVNRNLNLIREAAPDLKILLTGACSRLPSVKYQSVDIWVPQSHWVHYRNKAEAQAKGQEVWWYPCSGPWYPYPNYHLDIEPGAWRVFTWATWKYKFDGILYWATAFFNNRNPLKNNSYSSNGEGVLMYSLPDGSPIPSIRLKTIADSMEDYEYLLLLRDSAKKAAGNPAKRKLAEEAHELLRLKDIIRAIDDYALTAEEYNHFRSKAGALIEKLNRN